MSSSTPIGQNVHESKHPVVSHKISMLRSANTHARQFRSVLKEVTYHLGYEATASLKTREVQVSVPVGKELENEHMDCTGHKIADKICLIPVLRSGLGMVDGMLDLLPQAAVHHIGMYHVPGQAPVQYFNRLPRKCEADIAFLVDPVVGSAETAMATLAILKKWGVPQIHMIAVLASRQGLEKIAKAHPDVSITVGVVDEVLTEKGIVLPGLGDCGNRLYQSEPIVHDDDESLVLPSKRKRSIDEL